MRDLLGQCCQFVAGFLFGQLSTGGSSTGALRRRRDALKRWPPAIRLAAAARASAVMVRPDSMRAISSCRVSGSSSSTRVTRLPFGEPLGDPPVMRAARRHLRRMGHDQNLQAGAETLQPLADRRGDRAADAAVDLVEDQRRHRRGAGQHQLQRQHEARQLAARGDARERPERRAGDGRDLEMHALAAMLAPIGLGERGQHRRETAPCRAAAVSARPRHRHRDDRRQLGARARDALGRGGDIRRGRRRSPAPALSASSAPASIAPMPCGDRRRARPGRSATATWCLRAAARRAKSRSSTVSSSRGSSSRLRAAASSTASASAVSLAARSAAASASSSRPWARSRAALEAARCAGEGGLRAGGAGELADRLGQGFSQPLGVLQQGPAGGEAGPPRRLGAPARRARRGGGAANPLPRGWRRQAARPLLRADARRAPVVPGLRQRRCAACVLGEGVEHRAVVGRVEQAALLELALDFDQAVAELAQQADARRLVIDKGAAAAVGAQKPAQHNRVAVAVERRPRAGSRSAGWLRPTANSAVTAASPAPSRTSPASARLPSASPSASSRIDFPAPVSPVSTQSPGRNARSSRSIRTMSRMVSPSSIPRMI